MNRTQKAEFIDSLSGRLENAPFVVVADYRGITVAEITALRRALGEKGITYQVLKNTLALRAVSGTSKAKLEPYLTGMTGWIISGPDPIESAKAIREIVKGIKNKNRFVVKGGFFDGEAYNAEAIQKVADLPGKAELQTMLLRAIQEGPRQVLGVIQGPARDLLYLLKNLETKLAESEPTETGAA